MTRNVVYVLLCDGFVDRQIGYALPEIDASGAYAITTVGLCPGEVRSASGLRVVPDVGLNSVCEDVACAIVVPGGTGWESGFHPRAIAVLRRFGGCIPIAAIGSGTVLAAQAGLTTDRIHTSNGREYLSHHVQGYTSEATYVDTAAITDGSLITAGDGGALEFARELTIALRVFSAERAQEWYDAHMAVA